MAQECQVYIFDQMELQTWPFKDNNKIVEMIAMIYLIIK